PASRTPSPRSATLRRRRWPHLGADTPAGVRDRGRRGDGRAAPRPSHAAALGRAAGLRCLRARRPLSRRHRAAAEHVGPLRARRAHLGQHARRARRPVRDALPHPDGRADLGSLKTPGFVRCAPCAPPRSAPGAGDASHGTCPWALASGHLQPGSEDLMARDIHGKRVAILATKGVEQVELTEPRKALDQAGAHTELVSPEAGKIRAWNFTEWGDEFDVDVTLDAANPDDYDALLLPGG